MYIYRALLKHGYPNFSLSILEYCKPYKCLEREDYYLKLLNPEYNISLNPSAPMSGRTHSDESRQKISDAKKGENNPMFGKKHSDETKQKMSDAQQGNTHGFKKGQSRYEGSGRPLQAIEVTDVQTNQTTTYDSIHEAARALNLPNHKTISNYIKNNQQKPYKGIYSFRLLKK
jgi:group I intron endonuclease